MHPVLIKLGLFELRSWGIAFIAFWSIEWVESNKKRYQ